MIYEEHICCRGSGPVGQNCTDPILSYEPQEGAMGTTIALRRRFKYSRKSQKDTVRVLLLNIVFVLDEMEMVKVIWKLN